MTIMRNRAVINGFTGSPGLMTAYFDAGASPGTSHATEAAARVRAVWESFKAQIPAGVTIVYTGQVDLLDETTGALTGSLTGTLPVATTSTGGTTGLPNHVALVGQFITNVIVARRRVRGRVFLSPLISGANGQLGVLQAGTIAAGGTAIALLGNTIVTPIAHTVWHRPHGAGAGASCAVTGYGVLSKFGSIRSRRD